MLADRPAARIGTDGARSAPTRQHGTYGGAAPALNYASRVNRRVSRDHWPELPWRAWGDSLATLHMWTQIIGKLRVAATPPASHWWHAPLSVSARGLATSPIPYGRRLFQIDVDLV